MGNGNRPSLLCIEDPVQPGQTKKKENVQMCIEFVQDITAKAKKTQVFIGCWKGNPK